MRWIYSNRRPTVIVMHAGRSTVYDSSRLPATGLMVVTSSVIYDRHRPVLNSGIEMGALFYVFVTRIESIWETNRIISNLCRSNSTFLFTLKCYAYTYIMRVDNVLTGMEDIATRLVAQGVPSRSGAFGEIRRGRSDMNLTTVLHWIQSGRV